MDHIVTEKAAIRWGITDRIVLYYCKSGRIDGAIKMSNTWPVPKNSARL